MLYGSMTPEQQKRIANVTASLEKLAGSSSKRINHEELEAYANKSIAKLFAQAETKFDLDLSNKAMVDMRVSFRNAIKAADRKKNPRPDVD